MRLLRLLAAAAASFCSLHAQSTLGTLRGTVRDTTGAVVPGAVVTVRNVGQNTTVDSRTNDVGDYEVHNLNLGEYEITVEAAGFKKFVHSGAELNARQVQRVDARLEVGATQAEVTVTTGSQVISTETSAIDSARKQSDILGLPVAFRAGNTSLINFIALAPGVQIRGSNQANFSISGSRQSQNEVSVDGISTLGMRNHDVPIVLSSSFALV